jgi:hypothetical protein
MAETGECSLWREEENERLKNREIEKYDMP